MPRAPHPHRPSRPAGATTRITTPWGETPDSEAVVATTRVETMLERPFSCSYADGVLTLGGSVDEYAVAALRAAVREHSEEYRRPLAVELSDVDFLPSVAVGVLATGLRNAEENGTELALVAAPGTIAHRVLVITGMPFLETVPALDTSRRAPETA
ncbi:STAS domain-containing protein [Nocardioides sp. zg-579]|uniref:STAS domain-containing protein n=2 Tax=Nocardioides marmotae TaxID=2663857 RepID=A0A6I3JFN4_9ACTN|nr:STAS domain-containing protein [Gordonia jinghuaiqii]MTB96931.1 STAS domain-containing protein [Nocardioides marmotae]